MGLGALRERIASAEREVAGFRSANSQPLGRLPDVLAPPSSSSSFIKAAIVVDGNMGAVGSRLAPQMLGERCLPSLTVMELGNSFSSPLESPATTIATSSDGSTAGSPPKATGSSSSSLGCQGIADITMTGSPPMEPCPSYPSIASEGSTVGSGYCSPTAAPVGEEDGLELAGGRFTTLAAMDIKTGPSTAGPFPPSCRTEGDPSARSSVHGHLHNLRCPTITLTLSCTEGDTELEGQASQLSSASQGPNGISLMSDSSLRAAHVSSARAALPFSVREEEPEDIPRNSKVQAARSIPWKLLGCGCCMRLPTVKA